MKNLQAIIQMNYGPDNGGWLDYVREQVADIDEAADRCAHYRRSTGRTVRARVEDWSDGSHEPNVFLGEWDRSKLSPADQKNGVFRDII